MRILLLLLIAAVCINAGIFNWKSTGLGEKLKETFGGLSKILFKANVSAIHERLSKLKDRIRAKLSLSAEEVKALAERLKLVKRTKVDTVQAMGDTIEEINMKSHVGEYLFQGDIVLTSAQADEITEDIFDDGSARSKRQAFRDRRYPSTVWTNGVAYFFDENASSSVKSVFKKAAELWRKDTCINFMESKFATDKIRVFMEVGCWSYVGRTGGEQKLSLGNGCDSIGTAAHELGHALGFFHTHSRHDRDRFITPDWLDQFTMETVATNDNYGITYDPGSVMHYGSTSASANKEPTMVPKEAKYIETLGSPFVSFYDLLMLNKHYNCTEKCSPQTSAKCENGGFPHPRNCMKCICPGGYGGDLCNARPAGCGEVLEATSDFQTFTSTVGNKKLGTEPREDFDKCHYWIKAPAGKKIAVKLAKFTPGGIAVDGCSYAGVEIKAKHDQRLTGFRFCSTEDANTLLLSETNLVPVIVYNRIYASDVTIQYRFF
ncbi:unnamed protein product [Heligmosomoides polygyrus]|uniref:Zinc metalloproteinase n=1 Tax=Heligmosomoides polygyrus TaxID=6339 RepID=A0A183FJU9_HELPZ|nr:unnamed protein product [Heligmosomoides polygyrus]